MTTLLRRSALPAVLCLGLAIAGCDVRTGEHGLSFDIAHGKATDEWTRTYTVSPGGRVEIVNTNGLIEAFPAKGSQVEVVARREVRADSDDAATAALKKLEMLEESAPDHVKIEAGGGASGRGFFGRPNVQIHYKVSVPAGLNVTLRTQNGGVRFENVSGNLTASTTNGGVTGRGVSGSIDATTVNGGIQMELANVTADARIVTVNGGVRLSLAPDVNADLDASAVNGGVSVDDEIPLSAGERGRLRVSGKINNGGPKLIVQTTNGGIRVTTARAAEIHELRGPGS